MNEVRSNRIRGNFFLTIFKTVSVRLIQSQSYPVIEYYSLIRNSSFMLLLNCRKIDMMFLKII